MGDTVQAAYAELGRVGYRTGCGHVTPCEQLDLGAVVVCRASYTDRVIRNAIVSFEIRSNFQRLARPCWHAMASIMPSVAIPRMSG